MKNRMAWSRQKERTEDDSDSWCYRDPRSFSMLGRC
jgi:hypothetical protein